MREGEQPPVTGKGEVRGLSKRFKKWSRLEWLDLDETETIAAGSLNQIDFHFPVLHWW